MQRHLCRLCSNLTSVEANITLNVDPYFSKHHIASEQYARTGVMSGCRFKPTARTILDTPGSRLSQMQGMFVERVYLKLSKNVLTWVRKLWVRAEE